MTDTAKPFIDELHDSINGQEQPNKLSSNPQFNVSQESIIQLKQRMTFTRRLERAAFNMASDFMQEESKNPLDIENMQLLNARAIEMSQEDV